MNLGDFLRDAAARRYEPCVWDCITFPAAWVMANGQPDPMADWRGGYAADETEMFEVFAESADRAGLIRVDEPREGDVGVVSLLGQQAGAIFTGRRWAFVTTRGLAFASIEPAAVLGAWRLPHG